MVLSFLSSNNIDSFVHTSVFYLLNSIVALNDEKYQKQIEIKKKVQPFVWLELALVFFLAVYFNQLLKFTFFEKNIEYIATILKWLMVIIAIFSFILQAYAQSNSQSFDEEKASLVAQNIIRDEFKNRTLPQFNERKEYYKNEKRKFLTRDRKRKEKKK